MGKINTNTTLEHDCKEILFWEGQTQSLSIRLKWAHEDFEQKYGRSYETKCGQNEKPRVLNGFCPHF